MRGQNRYVTLPYHEVKQKTKQINPLQRAT